MPGRQLTVPKTQRHIRSNPRKRSLNAFAIASSSNPDDLKVRQHRLGESEGRNKAGKPVPANRGGPNSERQSNGPEKGQFDLSIDDGSDSEGNKWRLGQV
jgi:U3 small nucleolar RNA-associated protein 14